MCGLAVGPAHAPDFECTVKVRGWEFLGKGSNKKQAKTAAAEAALKYLHSVHSIDAMTGRDPAPADQIGESFTHGDGRFS